MSISFNDRAEAGEKLADVVEKYKNQPAVVYALPRGGVVLGAMIAKRLATPLDLAIPRKVGHPASPETAICAVSETGYRLCNSLVKTIDTEWLIAAATREIAEAKRRRQAYLGQRATPSVKNKIAIIVDDGIATGLTMLVAIHDIKKRQPSKVMVAVPVAPADTAQQIKTEVDEFIALAVIPSGFFGAVGAYYKEFAQVSDEEVVELLETGKLRQKYP